MAATVERAVREARRLGARQIDAALLDAHRRTASILADPADWRVPMLATINPPLWEYGHLAWFAEWWTLRDPRPVPGGGPMQPWVATRASLLPGADDLFDSARVAHDTRWDLPMPSPTVVTGYVAEVLERIRERLAHEGDDDADDDALHPYRLALFHEDMHGEALTCLRQTLDRPPPGAIDATLRATEVDVPLAMAGGGFARGLGGDGFAFDNEQPASDVDLPAFTIDAACVSNRAFLAFVEDGGYRDPAFWPGAAGRWRAAHRADHPSRWRPAAEGWQQRWFGTWGALALSTPVCHVNAFEAEAYCRWAGRRLPREAEWECAAVRDDRFDWGRAVWEWTADAFEPYPGFVPGRYREYSAPWFGTHRAVRGASFATHARMRHPRYRNFYMPERVDPFIGFRTCERDGR